MPGSVEDARRSARSHCEACSIRALNADELIALQEKEGLESVILVDVRSDPERRVASLPRSVSAAQFEAMTNDQLNERTIVCYCTVGKRSGDFVTQLDRRLVKPWRALYNSEGIVPYSHHPLAADSKTYGLVDQGGARANALHVFFAFLWDLGSDRFEVVSFGVFTALVAAICPSCLNDR